MTPKLIVFFLFLSLNALAQNEVLTNASVIEMVKSGFSSEIIILKIKSSRSAFATNIVDLEQLKNANVPKNIIKAMINPSAGAVVVNTVSTDTPVATGTNTEESGIFYEKEDNLIKIESSPISAAKAKSFGNTLAHDLSYGLARKQARLILKGEHSTTQIISTPLVFVFVFDKDNRNLNNNQNQNQEKGLVGVLSRLADAAVDYRYGKMGSASSPKDFVLAKTLNKRDKRTRELLTAGETVYDFGGGLDPSLLIEFTYERLKEGKYRVTIPNGLAPGEYCFFYTNARATQRATKELNLVTFDFGIPSPGESPK